MRYAISDDIFQFLISVSEEVSIFKNYHLDFLRWCKIIDTFVPPSQLSGARAPVDPKVYAYGLSVSLCVFVSFVYLCIWLCISLCVFGFLWLILYLTLALCVAFSVYLYGSPFVSLFVSLQLYSVASTPKLRIN